MKREQREEIAKYITKVSSALMDSGHHELAREGMEVQAMLQNMTGRTTFSPDQKAKLVSRALELKAQGMNYKEIAAELGVKHGSIYNWMYGSKPRR